MSMSDRGFKIAALKILASENAPEPRPVLPENIDSLSDKDIDTIFYYAVPWMREPIKNAKEPDEFMKNTEGLGATVSYSLSATQKSNFCSACGKILLPNEPVQCDACVLKDITDMKNAPRWLRRQKKERRGMPTKGHPQSDVFKGGSGRW